MKCVLIHYAYEWDDKLWFDFSHDNEICGINIGDIDRDDYMRKADLEVSSRMNQGDAIVGIRFENK